MPALTLISPLDGRYAGETKELSSIFSEAALFKNRLLIEIEYLIALSEEEKIKELSEISSADKSYLRSLYANFDLKEAIKIKKIEAKTNHDVKALEYYIKDKIKKQPALNNIREFVHFALTSDDVNNIAFSLMLKEGVESYKSTLSKLISGLKDLAIQNKSIPLLSLTHGQAATPSTVGKEIAVFYLRFKSQLESLERIRLKAKLSGATGNWNAHLVAYPEVNWLAFSQKFIESLGLEFNPLTTQIEPHDSSAECLHAIARCNAILRDLNQDVWLYISRGIFKQRKLAGEVGSSTMPHKINPWKFENSDGNLVMANAIIIAMAEKLPISKLQRDLSDSTLLRNQGLALGYSVLALKSTLNGLSRLDVDLQKTKAELADHWELLAEPIQVVLRKLSFKNPYEILKKFSRGENISKADFQNFIKGLKIDKEVKEQLLQLSPENYTGYAEHLVNQYINQ